MTLTGPWVGYSGAPFWDEMICDDAPHTAAAGVMRYLSSLGEEIHARQDAAQLAIRSMGVSFTVYSEAGNIDRAWPFDVIPRIISKQEWDVVSETQAFAVAVAA